MLIRELKEDDFEKVIELGNRIHGSGYLSPELLNEMFKKGIKNGINAHAVAECNGEIVGFRLTYAAGQWDIDNWCSPELWPYEQQDICYFKTNNVTPEWQGNGIGHRLLEHSINAIKKQGGKAGIAHIWKESPNNSSVRYFSKAGAKLIKEYPRRWSWENYDTSYNCAKCGGDCRCTACEMILPL